MSRTLRAYCFRSGKIEFDQTVPDGGIEIARGEAGCLRAAVEVTARHAYDGITLLVPGIPEAPHNRAAIKALDNYAAQVAHRLRGGRL